MPDVCNPMNYETPRLFFFPPLSLPHFCTASWVDTCRCSSGRRANTASAALVLEVNTITRLLIRERLHLKPLIYWWGKSSGELSLFFKYSMISELKASISRDRCSLCALCSPTVWLWKENWVMKGIAGFFFDLRAGLTEPVAPEDELTWFTSQREVNLLKRHQKNEKKWGLSVRLSSSWSG